MRHNLLAFIATILLSACTPVPVLLPSEEAPVAPKDGTDAHPTVASDTAFDSPIANPVFFSPLLTPPGQVIDLKGVPTPLPDRSTLVGSLRRSRTGGYQPHTNAIVRLAVIVWNEDRSDGAYFLDGANSPGCITDVRGTFVFSDVEPGDYVMIIGDVMGVSAIVTEKVGGKARVFALKAGEMENVGVIEVDLPIE